jgi:predicted DsbA family dithiol-disulfide isomerase
VKALLFADVTDPWSYIGATRFERAAATFTILTGEPVDLAFRAKLGEPEKLTLAEQDLADAAAKITGIDFNFAEVVPASSFDAWRMLTWAGAEAEPGVQRDLAHQLWRAYFLEGADVADPLVLSTRAALVGLDLETAEALLASEEYAAEVRTQDETAQALGITQLPHVVVETRWTLAGMHSQNDYVEALRQIHREWSSEEPG